MTLKPRDAIHADDLERYDAFMAALSDTQFLDMFLAETNVVQIDVYEGASPEKGPVHLAKFASSEHAGQYFEESAQLAAELLETPTGEELNKCINTCVCKQTEATAVPDQPLDKRLSRCI